VDDLYEQIERARAAIAARAPLTPRVGLILGSGLGSLADELEGGGAIPYAEIPGFPRSNWHWAGWAARRWR
jgi:purine-nucleoside phosphorylase